MNQTNVLLQAYYETLYDRLLARRPLMVKEIDELLVEQVEERRFEGFDDEKYAAYREAALAFVDERIEAYNPTGLQYLYDREVAKGAFELELRLDWFDSRAEFEALVAEARRRSADMTDEDIQALAEREPANVGLDKDTRSYPAADCLGQSVTRWGIERQRELPR